MDMRVADKQPGASAQIAMLLSLPCTGIRKMKKKSWPTQSQSIRGWADHMLSSPPERLNHLGMESLWIMYGVSERGVATHLSTSTTSRAVGRALGSYSRQRCTSASTVGGHSSGTLHQSTRGRP